MANNTLVDYSVFYREFGVKRLNQLLNITSDLVKTLPKKSRVHHLGSYENPNIDVTDPFYQARVNRVILTNIGTYPEEGTEGSFSKKTFDLVKAGNSFVRSYSKQFKYVHDLNSIAIGSSDLVVYNYGYLDVVYRYPALRDSPYNGLINKLKTIATVISRQKEDDVQNFLVLDVPETIVGPKALDRFSLLPSKNACLIFNTVEKVLLKEMWLWIDPEKDHGSFLDLLSEEKIKNTTFIFRLFDGKSVVINLGFLYSWVKGNKNLTDLNNIHQEPFQDVRRYYLKSLTTMQSINSTGRAMQAEMDAAAAKVKETIGAEKDEKGESSSEDDTFLEEQEKEAIAGSANDPGGLAEGKPGDGSESKPGDSVINDDTKAEIDLERERIELQADLDALDELDEKSMTNRQIQVKTGKDGSIEDVVVNSYDSDIVESAEDIEAMIFQSKTVDQALEEKLAKKADEGRISSSDYRKMMKMVSELQYQPDPYGSGKTVAEIVDIKAEDLKISKTQSEIAVPETVIDASMAKSSLNSFDAHYNTKILNRHIVQMMQGLQKSGVIIKSHTVETKHSVMGSYDLHIIELKPIDGQPSIIRHKVPIPDEEGTMIVKGVKCQARKQIVDKIHTVDLF